MQIHNIEEACYLYIVLRWFCTFFSFRFLLTIMEIYSNGSLGYGHRKFRGQQAMKPWTSTLLNSAFCDSLLLGVCDFTYLNLCFKIIFFCFSVILIS